MKLVIIEGIGKKATIEKYLGGDYKVFATGGHIRDLPKATLAVNIKNNFEPRYEILPEKKETVSKMLLTAKKADKIYLATDPDREGEAISWHLANILDVKPSEPVRIVFNEISKKAVQHALEHPRPIDIDLVDAQQARRVLDRLVGYKISPVLSRKIQSKLSAGRVQSVTLRLVVEREREILSFKPEEYWPFFSILDAEKLRIKAMLNTEKGKKIKLRSKEQVDTVVKALDGCAYIVDKVKKSIVKSKPPAPFITSTLQQDALNKLGMTLKQTTSIAQELYEGVEIAGEGKVALVTYIRTDSTRVSKDAQDDAKSFITAKYGQDFVPSKPNVFGGKKANVQDAHEAIRPITLERTPESLEKTLSRNHYRLYKLIFERFLASQMSDAQYNSMTVDINAGDYGFRVTGRTPHFAGYTVVYKNYEEEKEEGEEDSGKLPNLIEGQSLDFVEYKYEQKFTKPPSRYTDASLIKTMEEKGIGRPATYTPTVTLLAAREYTEKEGKYIKPTKLGFDITDMLIKYFPDLFDITFTAEMELKLDEIEEGGKEWQRVIASYYGDMEEKIGVALGDSFSLKKPAEKSGIICEQCGAEMLLKQGRYGDFLACPSYPKCKNTKPAEFINGVVTTPSSGAGKIATRDSESSKSSVAIDNDAEQNNQSQGSEKLCEKCGSPMVEKMGKFGKFLACSGYPKCKNIWKSEAKPAAEQTAGVAEENTESSEKCEKCGKPMVERMGKFGKFFACSGYPKCKNIKNVDNQSEQGLQNQVCPLCSKPLKIIRGRNVFYGCTGYPDCSFTSSYPLAEGKCPKCGSHLISVNNKTENVTKCGDKNCDYRAEVLSETK